MTRLPHPDTIAEQATELRLLWPALPAALPRDAGQTSGERVHTTPTVHLIPINPQVEAIIRRLTPHIGDLERLVREYGEAWTNRRNADAWPIARNIATWLRETRGALGLDKPDRPIGARCPYHDDTPAPLVTPGDKGELRYEAIDQHTGALIGGWIRWEHVELVTCRHCETRWTPARYLWLERLVRDADKRRTERTAEHERMTASSR